MPEEKSGLNIIIIGFLLIILGVVFTTQLADSNWINRNTYRVSNETLLSISNTTTVNIAHYPIASILYVTNATGAYKLVSASNYTATTDSVYNMYNGKFILNSVASDYDDEDVNISYTYYPAGYVRQSNAKILLNLIPLFFVIALLLFIVFPILKRFEVFE